MRLIDADELNRVNEESIAEYSEYYTGDMIHGMRIVCQYAVENAPTVDAIPIEYIRKWVLAQGYGRKQGWFITLRNFTKLIKDWEAGNEID